MEWKGFKFVDWMALPSVASMKVSLKLICGVGNCKGEKTDSNGQDYPC